MLNHEAKFREQMSKFRRGLMPEEAMERVKSKRDNWMAQPYNRKYPFVL